MGYRSIEAEIGYTPRGAPPEVWQIVSQIGRRDGGGVDFGDWRVTPEIFPKGVKEVAGRALLVLGTLFALGNAPERVEGASQEPPSPIVQEGDPGSPLLVESDSGKKGAFVSWRKICEGCDRSGVSWWCVEHKNGVRDWWDVGPCDPAVDPPADRCWETCFPPSKEMNVAYLWVRWDQPGFAELGWIGEEGEINWTNLRQELASTADAEGKFGAQFILSETTAKKGDWVIGVFFPDGELAGIAEPGKWPVSPEDFTP